MELSENGFEQLIEAEGLELEPYQDDAGVWTIGIGSTFYIDGKPVKKGDPPITKQQAIEIARYNFNKLYAPSIPTNVNQNQYDGLGLFVYNVGPAQFKKSTLRKKVLVNPNDPTIKNEFLKWVYITDPKDKTKKIKLPGLVNRRNREIGIYYKE